MKISSINQNYNKPQFKGKIRECDSMKKALTYFNNAELKEFNQLKNKMSKVNDGIVYSLLMGTSCDHDLTNKSFHYNSPDIYYRYAQLCAKKDDKFLNFYNKEIYQIDIGTRLHIGKIESDYKAFARAILEPLRKIYK